MKILQKSMFLVMIFVTNSLVGGYSLNNNFTFIKDSSYDEIIVEDSIAYLKVENEGKLQLINCLNTTEPNIINEVLVGDSLFAMSYFIKNEILYLCVSDIYTAYLIIINASNPLQMTQIGSIILESYFHILDSRIYVENNSIYILAFNLFCREILFEHMMNSLLFIVNCTDYSQLKIEHKQYFSYTPYINLFTKNDSIFLLNNYKVNATGFNIAKTVDNTTLLTIGKWNNSLLNYSIIFDSFHFYKEFLFIAYPEGFLIANISNEFSPVLLNYYESDIFINDICFSNSHLYAIGNNSIEIYQIGVTANLTLINKWAFDGDEEGYFYRGDISENRMYLLRSSDYKELHFFMINIEDNYNPIMIYPDPNWFDNYRRIPPMDYLKWILVFSSPLILIGTIQLIRRRKSKINH